jgi:hypothetical protein
VRLEVDGFDEPLEEELLVRCQNNKVVVSVSSSVFKRSLLGKHATLILGSTEPAPAFQYPVRDLQVRCVL